MRSSLSCLLATLALVGCSGDSTGPMSAPCDADIRAALADWAAADVQPSVDTTTSGGATVVTIVYPARPQFGRPSHSQTFTWRTGDSACTVGPLVEVP